jgi:radical SAM superfamily enzyme YgiQ (UPF0313 family)
MAKERTTVTKMDIVIAAVPYVNSDQPIMAPALLKSIAESHGFTSVAIDLNIEIYNRVNLLPNKDYVIDFFYTESITDPGIIDEVENIINHCARKIAEHNPKIIALSLLVYSCQIFTKWLSIKLRQLCPNAKIIIGGAGIKSFVANYDDEFATSSKNLGIIDDFIHGDAELSFVEYLKGNKEYPGINSLEKQILPNLNQLPVSDFTDYNFTQYHDPKIPIVDSRGCVKNCEFCDVIEFWEKFQWRDAANIFNEMLYQSEKYKINSFEFRSSLINGNTKEFKKLLDLMCDYNIKNPTQQISWSGNFIVRSKELHNKELWKKISISNGSIYIGVESVVPTIRANMGKPYTNEDLDWHLEASKIYNVPITLLLIVAYPYETLDDYEFTKSWFRNHRQYAASVKSVNLSYAGILPGTQLFRKSNDSGINKHPTLPSVWINQNLKISTATRLEYYKELVDICKNECGFNVLDNQKQTLIHTGKYGSSY